MSLPKRGNQQPPNGHTARAIVPKPRRDDIWDRVYSAFESKIRTGKWCTREELVEACAGKHGMIFTVEELTEVIRGKKKKTTLGIDSKKVDGEWQYRFTQPGATKTAASAAKLPPASPAKSSQSPPSLKRMAPATPKQANGPKPTPSKARANSAPKRNAPLRPRAKSPLSASKSPVARSSASRKRGPVKITASDGLNMETRLRSGSAKKPRVRRALGATAAVAAKTAPAGTEEGDRSGGRGGAVQPGAPEGEEGGSGWSCAIM